MVLIFPPFNSFHRFLAHKCTEDYKVLKSFSIGQGCQRRLVICDQADFKGEIPETGICMSKPKPSVGRGRARGRLRQDGSPGISPVGLRQAEAVQSNVPSTIPRTLDSNQSDVRVHTSDEDESRLKKNPRPRSKKPEVQLYVPRGRRSQDTGGSNHYSQTKESSPYHSNSPDCISTTYDESQYRNDTEIVQPRNDTFNNDRHGVVNDLAPKTCQDQTKCENEKPGPNTSRQRRARTNQIYVPPGRRKERVQTENQHSNEGFDGDNLNLGNRVTDISQRTNTQKKEDILDVNDRGVGRPKTSSEIELWEVDDSIVAMSDSKTCHNQNKYCENADEFEKNRAQENHLHSLSVDTSNPILNNQNFYNEIDQTSHKNENKDGSQTIDNYIPTNVQSYQVIKTVGRNVANCDISSSNTETSDHIENRSNPSIVSQLDSDLKDLANSGHKDAAVHMDCHAASEHKVIDTCHYNSNCNSLNLSADTVTLPGNEIIPQQEKSIVEDNSQIEHSGNVEMSRCNMSSGKLPVCPSTNFSDDICTDEKLAVDIGTSEKLAVGTGEESAIDTSEISQIACMNDTKISQINDEERDQFINEKNSTNSIENKDTLQPVKSKSQPEQGSDSVSNMSEESLAPNIHQITQHDSAPQIHDTSDFTKSEMTLPSDTSVLHTDDDTSVSNMKDDTSISNTNDDTSVSNSNDDASVSNSNDDTSVSNSNDDASVSITKDPSAFHIQGNSDSVTQDEIGTDECNIYLNVDSNTDMSERTGSDEEVKSVCKKEDTSSDRLKLIHSDISEENKALEKDKASESTTREQSETEVKYDDKVTLDEPNDTGNQTDDDNCRKMNKNEQHHIFEVAENKDKVKTNSEITEKEEKIKKTTKKKTPKIKKKLKKKLESSSTQNSDTTHAEDIPTSTNTDQVIKSTEDSDNEESWDKMFDDDGECLDPSLVQELTGNVGKVKVKKPVINYLNYQPDLDYEGMNHVIEIFDFSPELKTEDLLSAFSQFKSKGFDIKWVDDTHALGVFSSVIAANEALQFTHPLLKVRPLSLACRQSKLKAKRAVEFLQPYKPRPETTAVVARRMLTGALGLKTKVSKEQREKEREEKQKLKQAKEKKKKERQQQVDIWEGNITSNVQTEEET